MKFDSTYAPSTARGSDFVKSEPETRHVQEISCILSLTSLWFCFLSHYFFGSHLFMIYRKWTLNLRGLWSKWSICLWCSRTSYAFSFLSFPFHSCWVLPPPFPCKFPSPLLWSLSSSLWNNCLCFTHSLLLSLSEFVFSACSNDAASDMEGNIVNAEFEWRTLNLRISYAPTLMPIACFQFWLAVHEHELHSRNGF